MCGIFRRSGVCRGRRRSCTSASTRCSIADRNRPASSPSMTTGSARVSAQDGPRVRRLRRRHRRIARRRRWPSATRATARPARRRSRTRSRCSRASVAATSRSRTTATSPTRPSCAASSRTRDRSSRRRWTPRSSCIASRKSTAETPGEQARRGAAGRRRRVLDLLVLIGEHAARRARSARLASARDRANVGRRVRRRVRDVRARHRRRDGRCAKSSRVRSSRSTRSGMRSIMPFARRRTRAAACSSTCTSRVPTAACSAARSIARGARSAVDSRRSALPRAPSSCSAFPTRRTPPRSASPRSRGLPLELALIRNHYVGRTFIQPTQAGRDAKVKVKYNAVREVLDGKSVVMVDDSIVRGTTTRGLVAMVRAAGAREVHMRVSLVARSPVRATTASTRRIARS